MRRIAGLVLALAAAACGDDAPAVDAVTVERCLQETLSEDRWAKVPLSETAQAVFGIDLGANSVTIYVEDDAAEVAAEIAAIREAEEQIGNIAPDERVILRDRGNVLLSWANEPTQAQREVVLACVGFA